LHAVAAAGAAGACWCALICRNNRSPQFTQPGHGIAREVRKQQANLECEIAELEQVWRGIPTNRKCLCIFLYPGINLTSERLRSLYDGREYLTLWLWLVEGVRKVGGYRQPPFWVRSFSTPITPDYKSLLLVFQLIAQSRAIGARPMKALGAVRAARFCAAPLAFLTVRNKKMIKMALLTTLLTGLIATACASAWVSTLRIAAEQMAMRDDSCDDDWTRAGGAYSSNCFSRRRLE
jgi:hypothetical protein